ncbi:MAG: hypothetical protein WCX93_05430 [Burkholderiaceae bacterium]
MKTNHYFRDTARPRPSGAATPRIWQDVLAALDNWRFGRDRRHYYDYLAALLLGTHGSRTLKQVFAADARRYGGASPRGRLSHRWLELFQAAGGDLYATWIGVFPMAELAVLRSAQLRGNETLVATLAEMSRVLGVLGKARAILQASLMTAIIALAVLAITLLATPWFTVPRLRNTFDGIPAEYHGANTRSLFAFAETVGDVWPVVLAVFLVLPWLLALSFARHRGRLRRMLDLFGPWRVYRQVQALRFLALLAVALGRDEHGTTRLRLALSLQLAGGTPWLSGHIAAMLARVDTGEVGAAMFDTGLMDPAQVWFLDDMITARGLVEGLRRCSEWVERHVLGTVARQAAIMRWCLLLGTVASVLALALWHYAVIDDMRRALALFHASQ